MGQKQQIREEFEDPKIGVTRVRKREESVLSNVTWSLRERTAASGGSGDRNICCCDHFFK